MVASDGKSGRKLAEQIVEALESFGIIKEQLQSTTFDGAYHHTSVPRHLEEVMGIAEGQLHHTWDQMHRGGLTENHVLQNDKFEFVNEIVTVIAAIFKYFKWGSRYASLKETAHDLNLKLLNPESFSETRMANHKAKVIRKFLADFKPIVVTLNKIQQEKGRNPNKRADREAAQEAAIHATKICNQQFIYQACGIYDIYVIVGAIQAVLQFVNILPHVKYDKFTSLINNLREMAQTVVPESCCCTRNPWVDSDSGMY